MIALRDILIFAGLVALAAAVIASLFPVGEGASPVPACSDCAFKLTGGYWIRQYGNYASLYLGTREAARYGWAYRADGRPLSIGENSTCGSAMYLWVINGIAYVSCDGTPPRVGRDVLGPKLPFVDVRVSSDWRCTSYTIRFDGNLTESCVVTVEVYDEEGRRVASATGTIPGSVSFSIPVAGVYRVRISVPPLLDEWHTLIAHVRISDLIRTRVFASDNTEDLRPSISLKIFDLTSYWKKGYTSVTVRVNPAGASFTLSAPAGAFADFLLAWEDCSNCDPTRGALYVDEVWRLTVTQTNIVLARVYSQGGFWHEVYVHYRYAINIPGTKTLIWTWNKEGPKYSSYTVPWFVTTVWLESPDSAMNARASFAKECLWD
ncbi:MAG: hypothetical protein LM559_00400 [Pyrobaculum sp.]|nr:hypothetical protein [Pyrobaculum sp.]